MNEQRATMSEAERYWSGRLEQNFTLDGVGWMGLGKGFNTWMYAVRRRVFLRAVRGALDPSRARVLDVGSGTGFYLRLWQSLGASSITGSDLTAFAVGRLRDRFPGVQVEQLDISAVPLQIRGEYDAISAMDVLFHIVDDERYVQAIRNLAALLAPGGVLVLTENLLHKETVRVAHQASRTLAEVQELLGAAGVEIKARRPLFVLMNTPIDSESPLLELSWKGIASLSRHGFGWIVGMVLYPLELVLTRLVAEGPSTEIVVCQKPQRVDGRSELR